MSRSPHPAAPTVEPAAATAPSGHSAPRRVQRRDDLSDIMRRVQAGCGESFARLHETTSARLLRVVLRINRDRAEAEDILQEVYVKAWHQCAQFDPDRGHAMHWLAAIAHNAAVSSLRSRQREPQRFTDCAAPDAEPDAADDDPYDAIVSPWPEPAEAFEQRRTVAAVQSSLQALPQAHRTSLTLAFFDGLSQQEIATQLGKPLGTVKSWMRRSLLAMRPQLTAHLG